MCVCVLLFVSIYRAKVKTAEDSHVRNEWQTFKDKAAKKKPTGFVSNLKKESMFKSPEEVNGRVGVIGSGQGVTEFVTRKKAKLDNTGLKELVGASNGEE